MTTTTCLERRANALLNQYSRPAVLLHRAYPPQSAPVGQSYFGGLPMLPEGHDWPRSPTGVPMHFYCQIDCGQIDWPTALPKHGLLLFFGRDDAKGGCGGLPKVDCRVIYVPEAVGKELLTQPPADLPPISTDWVRTDHMNVTLEGEPPPRTYVKWPIRPLPIRSYPDGSGLPPWFHAMESDARRSIREMKVRKFLRRFFPQVSLLPVWSKASADHPVYDTYDRLLPAARAKALEDATGQKIVGSDYYRREREDGLEMFADDAFPQLWMLIKFFVCSVIRRYRGNPELVYPESTVEELFEYKELEDQLDVQARAWLVRSCAMPADAEPDAATRKEFREWAADIRRRPDYPSLGVDISWLSEATKWTIRECAADRALLAKLPSSAFDFLARQFRFADTNRDGTWFHFQFSQLLGDAPASQQAMPADAPETCLLNIGTDFGLGWSFGDGGEYTFWILSTDLAAHDFSRVRGTIEGG